MCVIVLNGEQLYLIVFNCYEYLYPRSDCTVFDFICPFVIALYFFCSSLSTLDLYFVLQSFNDTKKFLSTSTFFNLFRALFSEF